MNEDKTVELTEGGVIHLLDVAGKTYTATVVAVQMKRAFQVATTDKEKASRLDGVVLTGNAGDFLVAPTDGGEVKKYTSAEFAKFYRQVVFGSVLRTR